MCNLEIGCARDSLSAASKVEENLELTAVLRFSMLHVLGSETIQNTLGYCSNISNDRIIRNRERKRH